MAVLAGSTTELIYSNTAPGTALASFTSEALANDVAGMGVQAQLSPYYLDRFRWGLDELYILAYGLLSSTGTPTYTFTIRLGASGTTAPIVLGSAALTTASGVTNKLWRIQGIVSLQTRGADGANSTVRGTGIIDSPAGLAASGALLGGAAAPGTITTVDPSIVNFVNLNIACSASSASNTIQVLALSVFGLH